MDSSLSLLSASIQFLDTRLALIHIPLPLYRHFLQSVLQLLLPSAPSLAVQQHASNGAVPPPPPPVATPSPSEHAFLNISVTPIECSVVCSRALATDLFVPVLQLLDPASRASVHITSDDFVVMQVDGEGLDAGQRVLELTSPLAMAGIPIFFITTYFSDYMLVPQRHQAHVVHALEQRGFQFEDDTRSYVNAYHYSRKSSASSVADMAPPPSMPPSPPSLPLPPPPTTLSDLQTRTFATLARAAITPTIDPHLRLVQCASRKAPPRPHSSSSSSSTSTSTSTSSPSPPSSLLATNPNPNPNPTTTTTTIPPPPPPHEDPALHLALVKSLITAPLPRFLSLTLTASDPASLLLDHALLPLFPPDVLLGAKNDFLVPIALDLRTLPVESTGIVCGVAGRLMGGSGSGSGSGESGEGGKNGGGGENGGAGRDPVEMGYLSTARAGTVMVAEEELERAMGALRGCC